MNETPRVRKLNQRRLDECSKPCESVSRPSMTSRSRHPGGLLSRNIPRTRPWRIGTTKDSSSNRSNRTERRRKSAETSPAHAEAEKNSKNAAEGDLLVPQHAFALSEIRMPDGRATASCSRTELGVESVENPVRYRSPKRSRLLDTRARAGRHSRTLSRLGQFPILPVSPFLPAHRRICARHRATA